MLSELTAWLLGAIKTHGLLAVVLGVVIETVVVPLPSPLIIMTAGYILIPHGSPFQIVLSASWISVVAAIAQTIGSYMLYFIGYYGGKPFIIKFEKIHGVSWQEIKQFEKKFSKKNREFITLFMLRALPFMPLSVISGLCGIMKTKFKKYSIATFLGALPRNFSLAVLGFFLNGFYEALARKIDYAETVMTIILILMLLLYVIGKRTGAIDRIRAKILG